MADIFVEVLLSALWVKIGAPASILLAVVTFWPQIESAAGFVVVTGLKLAGLI